MKFHELALNSHFEYQHARYVKETPLVARNIDNNAKKFLARSAIVSVIASDVPQPGTIDENHLLPVLSVCKAFDKFYHHCLERLAQLPLAPATHDDIHAELEQAKQAFLNTIINA